MIPFRVLYKIDFFSQQLRKVNIMTSTNQKNMQTVHGNGTVSNTGLYNTGVNMAGDHEDNVPDDWEDVASDNEVFYDTDEETAERCDGPEYYGGGNGQSDDEVGYSSDEEENVFDCAEIKNALDHVEITPFKRTDLERVQRGALEDAISARDALEQKITEAAAAGRERDVEHRRARENTTDNQNVVSTEDAMELDNHEYPTLNATPVVKKQESKPGFEIVQTGGATWTEVKGKKGVQTFQLGTSMIAERKKERRQQITKTNDVRDKAFALMENKEELAKSLRKTTMCRSVGKTNANGTPTKCPYGDRCNFAHSIDELQIRMCKFEDRCRFIYTTPANEIRNRRGCKTCTAKHSGETDAGYFARTGICKIAKPRVVSPKPVVLPRFSKAGLVKEQARVTTENKEKMTKDTQTSGGTGWSHMMKRSAVQSSPPPVSFTTTSRSPSPATKKRKMSGGLTNPLFHQPGRTKFHIGSRPDSLADASSPTALPVEMTVMKVPAEFMGQAIEMAMKMGKTNIKFECA